MIYLYDGTFDGFLTCVYEHYYSEKADNICPPGAYQPDMLAESRRVRTDDEKAEKVETAIRDKISPYALARVYRVYRTNTDAKEMLLLNYLRFCFKRGPGAAFLHSHPLVHPVVAAEQKIGNEVHRLCGLIRFAAVYVSVTENAAAPASLAATAVTPALTHENAAGSVPAPLAATAVTPTPAHENAAMPVSAPLAATAAGTEVLYARVSPDHEALEFLAPHFSDRFKNEPFIIHDTKRGRAVFSWHRRWHIADFTEQDAAMLGTTAGEEAYRNLWRNYFDSMAIKERTNPRCQRNLMPARYWKNLPEMQLR